MANIVWIARDEDGALFAHNKQPEMDEEGQFYAEGGDFMALPEEWFPQIKKGEQRASVFQLL